MIDEEYDYDGYDPEGSYLMSALKEGRWDPVGHGVVEEMFVSHRTVYTFLSTYVADTGSLPEMRSVILRFPSHGLGDVATFTPEFCAGEVRKADYRRKVATVLAKAADLVAGGDVDQAVTEILKAAEIEHSDRLLEPTPASDITLFTPPEKVDSIPTFTTKLQQITNGIQPGHLWTMGARMKTGKSWMQCLASVAAASHGHDVIYFSLEMDKPTVAQRVHALMLGEWDDDADPAVRSAQVAEWEEEHGATVRFFDMADHPIVNSTLVGRYAKEGTLLVVDYIGLMSTTSQAASVEDWRNAATISNELRRVASVTGAAVLTAVQLNRSATGDKTPDLSTIADTDMYARDSDLVLLMQRHPNAKAAKLHVAANRHGPSGESVYIEFMPEYPKFDEINATAFRNAQELAKSSEVLGR